ncbi:hypothetical protein BDFB_008122 [Asbolus verrucosus]|uniref:Uncharacterized protein n=1 Tax=Asbolus verrucosus TaxID=1661398 RepID=A0A482V915_ASBVE|nr:hypothetical protein BDFB_008122 [Asbolus verrucosus]
MLKEHPCVFFAVKMVNRLKFIHLIVSSLRKEK